VHGGLSAYHGIGKYGLHHKRHHGRCHFGCGCAGPAFVLPRPPFHPPVVVPFPGHPPVVHPPIHPPVLRPPLHPGCGHGSRFGLHYGRGRFGFSFRF
jgi:hypothetical protein